MPTVRLEPTISASERPQTYALDSAATGTGRTIILRVVLYGCETWSRKLREKHGLRVFENRVLRGIFGPKGDEITRGMEKTT